MLRRCLRNLSRVTPTLFNTQLSIFRQPRFYFNADRGPEPEPEQEPPKGFEKFRRQKKAQKVQHEEKPVSPQSVDVQDKKSSNTQKGRKKLVKRASSKHQPQSEKKEAQPVEENQADKKEEKQASKKEETPVEEQKQEQKKQQTEQQENKQHTQQNTDPKEEPQPDSKNMKYRKIFMYGLLFFTGISLVKDIAGYGNRKTISQAEFLRNYLRINNVASIQVVRSIEDDSYHTYALVHTKLGLRNSGNQATRMMRGGQDKGTPPNPFDIMGVMGSKVKIYGIDSKVKVKFDDVAGLDEAKQEIKEFVDFLKHPQKYTDIGAKIPKGALLSGPPGTGKTMLAKACAGEAGVPFLFMSGSDFVEMFVGVGAQRVRDLFQQAKKKSPSIIFIDEIDAVGKKRDDGGRGGNDERDNTLNQLLVEMDGFGTDQSVIVLAATNRKDMLDPALTRPGRFDRTVDITLPDLEGRKQIFHVHLQPLKLDPSKTADEYAKRLATLTPGFSGADISNLCNEAAILAARKNKLTIDSHDFEMASERVLAGLEKKKIVSEEERKVVAVHESGHAVASWFLEGGHPLLKITIIPRSKGSLGFAQYLPNESSLETSEELFDKLCSILGGRCAEQLFFGKVTTGAQDDLKKAYEMAYAMVTKYGMSEKIGYIGYVQSVYNKSYSDLTNKLIDDEIKALIDKAAKKTHELVLEHKEKIQALSQLLLEKETLDLRLIKSILGDRPFAPKSNYKAYLEVVDEPQPVANSAEEGAQAAASQTSQSKT